MSEGESNRMVKISVAFEPQDLAWVERQAAALYGRRGLGLYIRKLVREDRQACERAAVPVEEPQ